MIECVPNFSEGRRAETLAALEAAARAAGARVLDGRQDPDHHRAVLTFCGEPGPVAEAAFAVTRTAAERIDLRSHRGRHPRIGATDVVPFVPLAGHAMDDCVALARSVGRRIGAELGIPVYCYGHAALRPDRRLLPDIRRGEFEGLARAIGSDPARDPDYGPRAIHPTAGAVAVGARPILVAYNIDLCTGDVAVARRIARAVRERDGGLPAIRALGFVLASRGRAQVSINVCDYRATSIRTVFERVRDLAEAAGASIHSSEIVGLVPREALPEAWIEPLKLEGFKPDRQILEERLRTA